MSRSSESMLHEMDYWGEILKDLSDLNDLVVAAADPVAEISVELLGLVLGEDKVTVTDRIHAKQNLSMDAIKSMGEKVSALVDLVGGRVAALEVERGAD